MRITVLYKSKYGASARYASMLAEALGTEAQELDRAGAAALSGCERAVFVGGVYAGGVAGLQKFAKLLSGGSMGRAAVLCVGASPYDEGAIAQLRGRCRALDESVPLFYARGAWDEDKMSLKDRTMCALLQKMVAKRPPEETEPWMRELLGARGQKRDWVSGEYLTPLLEYMRG